MPAGGVLDKNKDRILINLHGGGFVIGDTKTESIPIAAVGKIKVVSIDYRKGPSYKFPAASVDVAAVYKEILKEYRPEYIAIYASS